MRAGGAGDPNSVGNRRLRESVLSMRPKSPNFIRGRSQRKQVSERDHGVCAECGLDTEALLRAIDALPVEDWQKARVRAQQMREATGVSNPPFWHSDHILAVQEGGGACGIENLRTLCHRCHLKATRELRKRNTKAALTEAKLNRLRQLRETHGE